MDQLFFSKGLDAESITHRQNRGGGEAGGRRGEEDFTQMPKLRFKHLNCWSKIQCLNHTTQSVPASCSINPIYISPFFLSLSLTEKKKPLYITIMYLVWPSSDNNNQCAVQICIIHWLPLFLIEDKRVKSTSTDVSTERNILISRRSVFSAVNELIIFPNFLSCDMYMYTIRSFYNGHWLVTCKNSMWC